ncbi:MAG: hypothetical protein ACLQIB_00620 [Isosphaeraceae bacterium]
MRFLFGGLVILALTLISTGCTDAQLRITTLNQHATLTDLHYQMVLRNLAVFANNPDVIPWHTSITSGTAQVADAETARMAPLWNFYYIVKNNLNQVAPSVSGSRTVVQQWSTNPIVYSDALRLLQFAYRRAHGIDEMPDDKLMDDVAHDIKKQIIATEDLKTETYLFYQSVFTDKGKSFNSLRRGTTSTVGEQAFVPPPEGLDPLLDQKTPLAREVAHEVNEVVDDLRTVPTGWFGVGSKHDVPKNACYVAKDGHTYVWVTPEHRAELSKFVLIVMDLANAIQEPESLNIQGGLNFSPGFTAAP